jgi:ATP-dependent Clp protease ATP-binding subunit ClpA
MVPHKKDFMTDEIKISNYSERSLLCIQRAGEYAKAAGWASFGTENILIGIMDEGSSLAADALKEYGVTLDLVRVEMFKLRPPVKEKQTQQPMPSHMATRLLRKAEVEAEHWKERCVNPEHILLAMIGLHEGMGVQILKNMKIDLLLLKGHIMKKMRENLKHPAPPPLAGKALGELIRDMSREIKVLREEIQGIRKELSEINEVFGTWIWK